MAKQSIQDYMAGFKKVKVISGRDKFFVHNEPKHWIKTGLRPLDLAIGGKGLPSGRIVLISADASLGKTLLGLHLAKAFQQHPKKPGFVHFIETEGTVDPTWVENIGVNIDENLFQQAEVTCIEDLFEYIERSALYHCKYEPSRPILYYVDSVSICPPGSVLQKEYGKALKEKGAKARIISGFMERLEAKLRRTNITFLFISQLRARISMDPFNPVIGDSQVVTGGATLGYYNSLHLRLRQVFGGERYSYSDAKKKDRVYEQEGSEVEVYVYKNKAALPHRKAFLPIYWTETGGHPIGFDPLEADYQWLADRNFIEEYDGPDKDLRKVKGNQIRLPSGLYTFVGLSGWKQLMAYPERWQEVDVLMHANQHVRCRKDTTSEAQYNHQDKADTEEVLASIDELDAQLAGEGPSFEVEEEAPAKPTTRTKTRRTKR